MATARDPACRSFFMPFAPVDVLSAADMARIHETALDILEDIGMDMLNERACAIFRDAGADVSNEGRVRVPRELVEASVAKAPRSFRLYSQDASWYLTFGANSVNFGSVASAPYCSDRRGGRRAGTIADFRRLVRLADSLPEIRLICGYPVEPQDVSAPTRHLDALHAQLTLSNKPCHAYSLGGERIRDVLEMVKLARGVDDVGLAARPSVMTVVNASSPLRLDMPMAEGMLAMARAGQPVIATPFTLSGAMSPVTLAGALAQQNAEALAMVTLVQLAAPGAPVAYGGFTSNVDMRSGAPAFGTPEYARAVLAGGQLARRYALPYRSSNVNTSNAVDAQAIYESMTSQWSVMLAHANLVMHGAGWLEGGLTASFEKLVLDAENQKRLEDAFTLPDEEDWRVDPGDIAAMTREVISVSESEPAGSSVQASQESAPDAVARAEAEVERRLAAHVPPALPPERLEALAAYVARRTQEGGVEAA